MASKLTVDTLSPTVEVEDIAGDKMCDCYGMGSYGVPESSLGAESDVWVCSEVMVCLAVNESVSKSLYEESVRSTEISEVDTNVVSEVTDPECVVES